MKKLFIVACVVAFIGGMVYAAGRAYDDYTGSIAVEIDGADSTGFVRTAPIVYLMDGNADRQKYDGFIGNVYIPGWTDPGDSVSEGTDSAIIRYGFNYGYYDQVIEVDTITLPGTCFVAWQENIWSDPTATTWIGGDSTSAYGYIQPNLEGDYPCLQFDNFYIDYYMMDSVGNEGNLTNTITYFFRFFKDDNH